MDDGRYAEPRPTDRPTDRQPKSSGALARARQIECRRTRAPTQPLNDLTRRALQLIRAHACEPGIRLAKIAKALGRSESGVSHLLTIKTGLTFREHVEAVRLEKATVLLRDRDLSVKEAANPRWLVAL
jgi:AraC-like DNA-binding protein